MPVPQPLGSLAWLRCGPRGRLTLSLVAKLVESIAEMSNFETSGDCYELSQQSSFVGITLWNLLTHWVAEVVKTFEGWKIETLDEFRYATQCRQQLLQKKTVANVATV